MWEKLHHNNLSDRWTIYAAELALQNVRDLKGAAYVNVSQQTLYSSKQHNLHSSVPVTQAFTKLVCSGAYVISVGQGSNGVKFSLLISPLIADNECFLQTTDGLAVPVFTFLQQEWRGIPHDSSCTCSVFVRKMHFLNSGMGLFEYPYTWGWNWFTRNILLIFYCQLWLNLSILQLEQSYLLQLVFVR